MAILCIGTVVGALGGLVIGVFAAVADSVERNRFYREIGIE